MPVFERPEVLRHPPLDDDRYSFVQLNGDHGDDRSQLLQRLSSGLLAPAAGLRTAAVLLAMGALWATTAQRSARVLLNRSGTRVALADSFGVRHALLTIALNSPLVVSITSAVVLGSFGSNQLAKGLGIGELNWLVRLPSAAILLLWALFLIRRAGRAILLTHSGYAGVKGLSKGIET